MPHSPPKRGGGVVWGGPGLAGVFVKPDEFSPERLHGEYDAAES